MHLPYDFTYSCHISYFIVHLISFSFIYIISCPILFHEDMYQTFFSNMFKFFGCDGRPSWTMGERVPSWLPSFELTVEGGQPLWSSTVHLQKYEISPRLWDEINKSNVGTVDSLECNSKTFDLTWEHTYYPSLGMFDLSEVAQGLSTHPKLGPKTPLYCSSFSLLACIFVHTYSYNIFFKSWNMVTYLSLHSLTFSVYIHILHSHFISYFTCAPYLRQLSSHITRFHMFLICIIYPLYVNF